MEKVGFVGPGIMGAAMARNLPAAGHGLVVHNRTRAKAEELAEHGTNVADSPGEVAEACSVVVTMLPGPRALYAVDGTCRPLIYAEAATRLV